MGVELSSAKEESSHSTRTGEGGPFTVHIGEECDLHGA